MALYARLLGEGPTATHINVTDFVYACIENVADRLLINDLGAAFALDTGEQTEAEGFINTFGSGAPTTTAEFAERVLTLGRAGIMYTTETEVKDAIDPTRQWV